MAKDGIQVKIRADAISTIKQIKRARKHISPAQIKRINYDSAKTAKRDLQGKIRTRWTGKLKKSVMVFREGNGARVSIPNKEQAQIFEWYDQGRRGIRNKGGGMVFVPLTSLGHEGYNPDHKPDDESTIKYGRDFILKKRVKPFRGRKVRTPVIRRAKNYWNNRVNRLSRKIVFQLGKK